MNLQPLDLMVVDPRQNDPGGKQNGSDKKIGRKVMLIAMSLAEITPSARKQAIKPQKIRTGTGKQKFSFRESEPEGAVKNVLHFIPCHEDLPEDSF